MKKIVFGFITSLFTLAIIGGGLYLSKDMIVALVEPKLLSYVTTNIPDDKLRKMYAEAVSNIGFYWDTVPDPKVARLGKAGMSLISKKAEIRINNAGLRSSVPYVKKPEDVYRIVCLGDSFVFGEAGKEEDRFCDQIAEYYKTHGKTLDGKRIEAYSLGLGSWTAIQEATYLNSRISAYDPDIIVMLTVSNDITDISGVTGGGTTTLSFSPEHRSWGSGVFTNIAGISFGYSVYTALMMDFSHESHIRWDNAWAHIKRLVHLQESRGKKILLAVLDRSGPHFVEVYKQRYLNSGMDAPAMVMNFFPKKGTQLPHDGHPSRAGHAILASHIINSFDSLGWISMGEENLPVLDKDLDKGFIESADPGTMTRHRNGLLKLFKSSIDFENLSLQDSRGFLGGLFPEKKSETQSAASVVTWATVRTGFSLAYPDKQASHKLKLEIDVPAIVELYPFDLNIRINNEITRKLHLASIDDAGKQTFDIPVAGPTELDPVLEVLLETDSYFSGINDHRMKSYQLLNASVE